MDLTKREIVATGAGALIASAFSNQAKATSNPVSTIDVTAQTQLAIDYYTSLNIRSGFILDKASAKMIIFENGRAVAETSALYGRGQGGNERLDEKATPEGTFNLEILSHPSYNRWYGGSVIAFQWSSSGFVYAIHQTYLGNPSENREQRLATPTPDDNDISNGCINVSPEFYDRLIEEIRKHIRSGYPNRFGGSLPIMGSMPETDDVNFTRTRQVLGIPVDFRPHAQPNSRNEHQAIPAP
jgi:hypothetical protein